LSVVGWFLAAAYGHLLAVFKTDAATSDIDSLLGRVDHKSRLLPSRQEEDEAAA